MASTSIFSDNTTAGISFAPPSVTLTSANMGINGGLSFDIPLASATMSQNTALSYMSANTQQIGRALAGLVQWGGPQLDLVISSSGAQVSGTANQALGYYAQSLNTSLANIKGISEIGLSNQRYATKKGSKLCFITTAVCEARGLPDDCEELETLRAWRDTNLRCMPGGAALIAIYYRRAPMIVERLKKNPNAENLFREMLTCYIHPAIAAIKAHNHDRAFDLYCALMNFADEESSRA